MFGGTDSHSKHSHNTMYYDYAQNVRKLNQYATSTLIKSIRSEVIPQSLYY